MASPPPRPSVDSLESQTEDLSCRRSARNAASVAATAKQQGPGSLDTLLNGTTQQPARLKQAIEQFPKGAVIISHGAPRTQGIVVGHSVTTGGAPLIQTFQAGYFRAHTGEWIPPALHDRLQSKLPQQEQPPIAVFPVLDAVRTHLERLYNDSSPLTPTDVEPLIAYLETTRKPRANSPSRNRFPPSNGFQTLNGDTMAYGPPSSSQFGRGPKTMEEMETSSTPTTPRQQTAHTQSLEELTKRVRDLDAFVRANKQTNSSLQAAAQPPLLPSPPTMFHDTRSSDSSSSHSRSRSRSRSRERSMVRLKKYALITVPCPFSDMRAAIPPAARASGSARQRRFFRRILADIYIFYPSALLLAQHIIALNRQTGSAILTWEEATLLHWGRALDYALLEANGGSWSLWSEPVVDCLLRGFLEMAVRASPDHEPPLGLDPSTAAKLRRLKYGKTRDYGPLPKQNNYQNRPRRQNFNAQPYDRQAATNTTPTTNAATNNQSQNTNRRTFPPTA